MYLISDGGINTNCLDTIESVMLTKNMINIDGVKLDIRKSKDNVFVISRYEELEKFTYGKGKIYEYNYNYLRKIKFPSHIFKYFIPTLDEILKNYNKDKIIVLELFSESDLDKLFVILAKYNYKYYFLSNNNSILDRLKKLDFDKIGIILSNDDIVYQDNNNFLINDHISTN